MKLGRRANNTISPTVALLGIVLSMMMLAAAMRAVPHADAADFIVTASLRDFPMKDGDVIYRDYYLNAGTNNGLKEGVFIDATRRMPVFDNINSKIIGNTMVKIGRLRIIHADRSFSVARLVELNPKENTPLLGYDAVMIGDLIEVSEKQ